MAKTISKLSITLGASVAPFVNAFQGAKTTVGSFVSQMGAAGSAVLKFTGIAGAIGAVFGALRGAGSSIGLAVELEQTEVAFTTMLRSGEAAKGMMAQLASFAASTPFEFPELAKAAKSLLAFGVTADQIQPALTKIGDISAGIGAPIGEIAELFGKARVQGTLYAEDINQLVGRGIPVIQEFAKQLGVSEAEVKKMASAGKISFGMLDKAFTDLTSNGGQFSGMMAAQSKTLGGLWSSFTDNLSMSMAGVVTTLIDAFKLKGAIASLGEFVGTAGAWLNAGVARWVPVFVNFGAGVWGAITGAFTAVVDWLRPVVTGIGDFIASNWQQTVTVSTAYLLAVGTLVRSVFIAAMGIVSTVGEGIVGAWAWSMGLLGVTTTDTGSTFGNVFQMIVDVGRWMQGVLTVAFVSLAYVISNWRDVVGLAISAVQLSVVQAGAEIVYQFGTVIPGVLAWMGRNWFQIMTDVASFTATVVGNVAANLTSFVSGVASLLTGGGFSFEWTALTAGFESSLKEMPQIAARQIGPLEASLQQQFDAMQAVVGNGLAAALDGNKASTDAITKGVADAVSAATATAPAIAPKIAEIPGIKIPTAEAKVDTKAADDAIDKTNDKAAKAAATIANIGVGSAEQMQRIALAAFTPSMAGSATDSTPDVASAAPMASRTTRAMTDRPKREDKAKPLDGPALLAAVNGTTKAVKDIELELVEVG